MVEDGSEAHRDGKEGLENDEVLCRIDSVPIGNVIPMFRRYPEVVGTGSFGLDTATATATQAETDGRMSYLSGKANVEVDPTIQLVPWLGTAEVN